MSDSEITITDLVITQDSRGDACVILIIENRAPQTWAPVPAAWLADFGLAFCGGALSCRSMPVICLSRWDGDRLTALGTLGREHWLDFGDDPDEEISPTTLAYTYLAQRWARPALAIDRQPRASDFELADMCAAALARGWNN